MSLVLHLLYIYMFQINVHRATLVSNNVHRMLFSSSSVHCLLVKCIPQLGGGAGEKKLTEQGRVDLLVDRFVGSLVYKLTDR